MYRLRQEPKDGPAKIHGGGGTDAAAMSARQGRGGGDVRQRQRTAGGMGPSDFPIGIAEMSDATDGIPDDERVVAS